MILIEDMFKKEKHIILSDIKLKQFINGCIISINKQNLKPSLIEEVYRVYDEQNRFIGIGKVKNGKIKRDVII